MDIHNHLVRILTTLNEIGASITQLGVGQELPETLRLIADGAVRAVANSADVSAVIWIYDAHREQFEPLSRVSAGEPLAFQAVDFPRPDGLGMQAIERRRRVLSYESGSEPMNPSMVRLGVNSMACFPLFVANEAVGALYVYRTDTHRFSEVELLILENFVRLAAIAIHYGRKVGGLNRALSRKVSEMEKLNRASNLISSRTNLDETLQEILTIGLDLTAAQYGSFEFYDRHRGVLVNRALAGSRNNLSTAPDLPIDESSVIGKVALHRRTLRIGDLHAPPWCDVYQPLPIDREMLSELAVPLVGAGGGLEGVLNIESPRRDAFSEEDQQLLEALATQAVIAVQEIRLFDAMQLIVQKLLTAKYDDLLSLIIDRACELINVSAGAIWIVSEPDTLVLRQSTEPSQIGDSLPLHNSFTGQAVRLRQAVTIDDIRQHSEFMHPNIAHEKGWVSAIVVPLLAAVDELHPVGSFSLYATELRDFSDWDKKMLSFLANHAAVAIRDAEQLRQLKQAQERQATAETIAAVGDMAANLIHQLNNKLGAISVRVQAIEDKNADILMAQPDLARNLHVISSDLREAMAIVRESMAPLQPTSVQPVTVARCMKRALDRANLSAEIRVFLEGIDKLPRVLAGEKQLEMVFYNLLDNASKAMRGSGQLEIVGFQNEMMVAVSVTDTGPGIPALQQARIFELTAARTEEPADSLSFGLWWVKTFVERFGGRVTLESKVGRGSKFTVWLPVAKNV